MSADNAALLIAVVILVVIGVLSRLHVWRRCRCGASYCNDCGRRK